MNKGVSNIGRTNKVDAVVVPAPTVTGARSGTSLSGTFVELGGALSPLLHNTVIDIGLFDFLMQDAFNEYLFFDRSAAYAILGDQNQAASVRTDQANGQVQIGDTLGNANGDILIVDDTGRALSFQDTGDNYLLFDVANKLYRIGDINNVGNHTKIDIKDASQAIELDAGLSPSRLTLAGTPGAESLVVDMAGGQYLLLDPVAGNYRIGDISGGAGNETLISILDTAQTVNASSNSRVMLSLNMAAGLYQIGDITPNANNTLLAINDATQIISTASAGSVNGLSVDLNNLNFLLGDFFGTGNGNYISINDSLNLLNFGIVGSPVIEANGSVAAFSVTLGDVAGMANGTLFSINDSSQIALINAQTRINFFSTSVGVNLTPTVSPFGVAALPAFANNAAAVVGGLNVGAFYRISVAGTSAVAVVE